MKWLVGFLVLFNAGLFLWATGHAPARSTNSSGYPVVGPQGMRLLSEVRPRVRSSTEDAFHCARIGPFDSSAVLDLAAQKLDAMSLNYSRRTIKSRKIRAFRVFLGPFATQSAIHAQLQLLNTAAIKDYYVKRDEDNGTIVSLGLFSQKDGAEALLAKLSRAGVQAKLRTENRVLRPSFWLEIKDPKVAHGIPPELARAHWGDKAAKITRYACP